MVPEPHDLTPITESEGEARRLIEDAYRTSFRDDSPTPAVGTAPPVSQPGRPPMSQRATDVSGVMLATGIASMPISGGISLVMWTVGQVDPVVVGIVCVAPVVFLGALSRVFKRAKDVAAATPPTHHHHYEGSVVQDHSRYSTETRGLIARTRNELRR
ncbi:hypothetical protein [Streptomyces pristinaespiralis]|uniref:hypothetical protein n=1 Tax=Streptomyces pristinaespiralis TaxID=38300 RepID=UPI00340C48B6